MIKKGITASFALGGITGGIVDLHKKGLIGKLYDTQSFDADAAESLRTAPNHYEISTNAYANPGSKAAYCDQMDMVILSALEIDLDFNVNVITGSDGVMRGASGGHCDVAAAANLSIVVGPLIRSRIPTVVRNVTTLVTPGECVGVLVTDHGIAVNPNRPEVAQRLIAAGLPVMPIEELYRRAIELTGEPEPIAFLDKVVGIIRYPRRQRHRRGPSGQGLNMGEETTSGTGSPVNLEQMLEARERRAARQRVLLASHALPVVSLTVVMPGPVKDSPLSRTLLAFARTALDSLFIFRGWPVHQVLSIEEPTGPEALYAVDTDPRTLKEALIDLEDDHPLGRLWDLDVIDPSQGQITRRDLGKAPPVLPDLRWRRPCLRPLGGASLDHTADGYRGEGRCLSPASKGLTATPPSAATAISALSPAGSAAWRTMPCWPKSP